jgi:ribosome maturation factor RimP
MPGDPTVSTIVELIEPALNDMGFELVQVRFMKGPGSTTLQVMAEPLDRGRGMTVEDCAEISHAVSAVLDVADPIAGAYRLEVSSPGVDRPLVKPEDFVRFAGSAARIELTEPAEGRKRFMGTLAGCADGEVLIEVEGERLRFPLARIGKAKLTVAESLIGARRGAPRRRRS